MIRKEGDKWVVYDSTGKRKLGEHDTEVEAERQLAAIESNSIRVNLACAVNRADIRREERNGREHIVVPSFTLPENVIMNGGLYPAEEIDRSYSALEGTFAPLGHPQLDGQFVSAKLPEAINAYHVGAFNRNVEKRGRRIAVEKWIDVEVAQQTEKGRKLLAAIEAGEPIHTSTGVFLYKEPAPENAQGYDWIARNMQFDHDAILLGEIGAATPEQGVGMMVNTSRAVAVNLGERVLGPDSWGSRMTAISEAVRHRFGRPDSYACVDDFDDRRVIYSTGDGTFFIDYILLNGIARLEGEPLPAQSTVSYFARNDDGGVIHKFLQWMRNALHSDPSTHQPPEDQDMTPEELKALLDAQADKVTAAVNAAVEPLTARLDKAEAALAANAEAALAEKRATVAAAWGEDIAAGMTANALDAALLKLQTSAPLLHGRPVVNGANKPDYSQPID